MSNNSGTASGPGGTAAGGGIWNGVDLSGPPVQLTLVRTAVTRNVVSAGPGITVQGGGLFTTLPVTLTSSVIAGNVPDQCSGCTSSAAPAGLQARENNQAGRGAVTARPSVRAALNVVAPGMARPASAGPCGYIVAPGAAWLEAQDLLSSSRRIGRGRCRR